MDEVLKCPRCNGELEPGFIHAPSGAFWEKRKLGWKFAFGEHEWLIPRLVLEIPKTQGWRCTKCSLVVFFYDEEGVEP